MDTPLAPAPVQGRRGKKHRMDLSSPTAHSDFDRAIDLVAKDSSLPLHLKTAMGFLFDLKDQIGSVLARNKELLEENKSLRLKNNSSHLSHRIMSSAPIILNVGGTKFFTSEATLRSRSAGKGCIFATLDYSKGEVFIDRDPTLFKYILNYLRDGRVVFPDDALTTALLFQEAKFYGLGHLVEQISLICKNSTGYNDVKAPKC